MSKKEIKRKTFYIDDDEDKPITAGGVIIYRFGKKGMELLLVESRGTYEDLGGRVDDEDKNIYTTVSREAYEESNYLLNKSSIKKRIKKKPRFAYAKRSKYIVYMIESTEEEADLVSKEFGDRELHDDILRKIKWIPLKKFLSNEIVQYKLNFRLKNAILFNILKDIEKDKKNDFNMFSNKTKSDEKPKKK
jgi:hypothetical protein